MCGRGIAMEETTMTIEEFDRRLTEGTERDRQERLIIEAENAELRDLISRYSAMLERLEAELDQARQGQLPDKSELRETLRQLAERSVAVASALCFAHKRNALFALRMPCGAGIVAYPSMTLARS